jgi:hypothetical protein
MDFASASGKVFEVSEVKVEDSGQFSEKSLEKFDKIFGDDKIDKARIEYEEPYELNSEVVKNKFDKLFMDEELDMQTESEKLTDGSEKKELTEEEKLEKIQEFIDGKIGFEEVKEIIAEYYAKCVNSNRPWSWGEDVPGGDWLTGGQRKEICEYAREKGMVPTVPVYQRDGKRIADFSQFRVFQCILDRGDWNKSDLEQFAKCNEMLKKAIEENPELAKKFTEQQLKEIMDGKTPSGYTWHHSEKDGTMELVPYGVHNSTYHCGGRSEGYWADAPR